VTLSAGTPPAAARLVWRTHAALEGGYVRTARGRDGSIICETFLCDHGRTGPGVEMWLRAVIVPAALADAFVRGLVADVRPNRKADA